MQFLEQWSYFSEHCYPFSNIVIHFRECVSAFALLCGIHVGSAISRRVYYTKCDASCFRKMCDSQQGDGNASLCFELAGAALGAGRASGLVVGVAVSGRVQLAPTGRTGPLRTNLNFGGPIESR